MGLMLSGLKTAIREGLENKVAKPSPVIQP
jgi:hypothetical protein